MNRYSGTSKDACFRWAFGLIIVTAVAGCGESLTDAELALTVEDSISQRQSEQKVMSSFDVKANGFDFKNQFVNGPISIPIPIGLLGVPIPFWNFDFPSGSGLCGGMTYAVADYFNAGMAIPSQDYQPAIGTTLHSYLYDRQVTSLNTNLEKWVELTFNPDGARDREFWSWGVQGTNGGRLEELRRYLDAGQVVPLGLFGDGPGTSCSDCSHHHQVLAIGYDLNGYDGKGGSLSGNLKIFVLDPNKPHEIKTLRPSPASSRYFYEPTAAEKGMSKPPPLTQWRTYFVDTDYTPQKPPKITLPAREVRLIIQNWSSQELEDGVELDALLILQNGTKYRFPNINKSRLLPTGSKNAFSLELPKSLWFGDIRGVRIELYGTWDSGKEWDIASLRLETVNSLGHMRVLDLAGTKDKSGNIISPLWPFFKRGSARDFVRTARPGFLIGSDKDSRLFMKTTGKDGSPVTLSRACEQDDKTCTWSYVNGLLLSDANPALALNAWQGARHGAPLVITSLCSVQNPDCLWTYEKGQFKSDNNGMAINAWNGAEDGISLYLHQGCSEKNPDCTWFLPHVMFSGAKLESKAVNAYGGASGPGIPLKLNTDCTVDNPDCTFTFSHGEIRSDRKSNLAIAAWGSAGNADLKLKDNCTPSDPDCIWTWRRGGLVSGRSSRIYVRADSTNQLALDEQCSVDEGECLFTAFFGNMPYIGRR